MSPFLFLLANGDSCPSLLSLKGDIYPDDKSAISAKGIEVLVFGDRSARGRQQVAPGGMATS